MSSSPEAQFKRPFDVTSHLIDALVVAINVGAEQQAEIENLKELATTDPLTGLLNRRAFEEQFDLIARPRPLVRRRSGDNAPAEDPNMHSLLYLDLDNFKRVNDVYDHVAGDVLLKTVGGELRECTRAMDVIARLGGDEFAVLLPSTGEETACVVGERIRERIKDTDYGTTASIGIVTFNAAINPNTAIDSVIHMADVAHRVAKNMVGGPNDHGDRVVAYSSLS